MKEDDSWDAGRYTANARFVTELGRPVLDLLDPRPRERVLDLGCGDGVLTQCLLEQECDALAVDVSEKMVRAARAAGVNARCLDGQELDFDEQFDAVFSNAALHWMRRPEAVVTGVFRALRPGGRFVAEMGGRGNVAQLRAAMHGALRRRGIDAESVDPWYFPALDEYAELLRGHGFVVAYITSIPRPTALPTGVSAWLEAVAHPFLKAVAAAQREEFIREVEQTLEARLKDPQGQWWADYVRLRFKALKPA